MLEHIRSTFQHPPPPPCWTDSLSTLKLAQVCSANTGRSAAVNRHDAAASAGGPSQRAARLVFREDLLNCTGNKREETAVCNLRVRKPLTWLHCTHVVILVRAAFEKASQCGSHLMARGANLHKKMVNNSTWTWKHKLHRNRNNDRNQWEQLL